jgi:hypothetical protein
MEFVRIEMGGYRQETVIGSLTVPEYQLAISAPDAFAYRMDHEGNHRYFHECDDLTHYCGMVMDEWAAAKVVAMSRDGGVEKLMRTMWHGPAALLVKDIKIVRPEPYWWAPIEQRRYRAWFTNTEKRACCDFDIEISPQEFSRRKMSARITWAYGCPVYTGLCHDGRPLKENFVSSNGAYGISWKVQEMDRRSLLAEEAKLERLGLLRNVTFRTILDYDEDMPVEVEAIETSEQWERAFGQPRPEHGTV